MPKLFVINERVFISNMAFSVVFLDRYDRRVSVKRGRFIAATAAAAAGGIVVPARAQIPQQPGFPNQQFLQQLTIGGQRDALGRLGEIRRAKSSRACRPPSTRQNRFTPPVSHVWGYRALDDRNDAGLAATNANVAAADST